MSSKKRTENRNYTIKNTMRILKSSLSSHKHLTHIHTARSNNNSNAFKT